MEEGEGYGVVKGLECGSQSVCGNNPYGHTPHYCDIDQGRKTSICQFFELCKGACTGYGASSDLCQSCVQLAGRRELEPIFQCCDSDGYTTDMQDVCEMAEKQQQPFLDVCHSNCHGNVICECERLFGWCNNAVAAAPIEDGDDVLDGSSIAGQSNR